MNEHLQHTSLPYMVLAGDTDSKQTSFRRPCLQDIYMFEILPLSSQFECNMSGTRKENKRKSTPSLKFGDNSKLSVLIAIDSPLPSSHLQIGHELRLKFYKMKAHFLPLKCRISSKI